MEIGRVKIFHHLPARIVECVSEYKFLYKKKKKHHIYRSKKQKKLKKIEKEKKPTKIGRKKKMLLLLTISVENVTGYDVVVWQYALCTFNLRDQLTKSERVQKTTNFGKHLYIFVYFLIKMKNKICKCSKNIFSYIFYSFYLK